jgi:hypothetical protein
MSFAVEAAASSNKKALITRFAQDHCGRETGVQKRKDETPITTMQLLRFTR